MVPFFIVPPNSTSNSAEIYSKNTIFLRGFGTIWGPIRGTIFLFPEEYSIFPCKKKNRYCIAIAVAALPPPLPLCCRHHCRCHWRPCPLLSPLSLRSLAPALSAAIAFVYIFIIVASLLLFLSPLQLLLLVDCWLFVPLPPPPPCCCHHRRAATAVAALPPRWRRLHSQAATAATAAKLPLPPPPPRYCCCRRPHKNSFLPQRLFFGTIWGSCLKILPYN